MIPPHKIKIRPYLSGLPKQEIGWLAAARDQVVGRSLMLLHSRTAHPWTIAELAKEVESSRSALVERFTRDLAEPPMAYLIRCRLQLAARALGSTSKASLISQKKWATNLKPHSTAHSSANSAPRPHVIEENKERREFRAYPFTES